jgi:hypothetical protein
MIGVLGDSFGDPENRDRPQVNSAPQPMLAALQFSDSAPCGHLVVNELPKIDDSNDQTQARARAFY